MSPQTPPKPPTATAPAPRRVVAVVETAQLVAQLLREMLGDVGMIERIGLRLRVVVVHAACFDARCESHRAATTRSVPETLERPA